MKSIKFSAGLWIYGIIPDRYLPSGYQKLIDLESKLVEAKDSLGVEAIELPYGPILNLENVTEIEKMFKKVGLKISSLTVNVVGDQKWAKGSISNPDPLIRVQAKQMIKDAMKAAKQLHVKTVNLWMGQEGFDYPFEADYSNLWLLIQNGLTECAKSQPEIELCIEYKRMEPRARNIPNSATQALLFAINSGCDNLKVTIDIGHAILGGENPSQSLTLLKDFNKLGHIHINDNYADWDWDMVAGVNHWWQLVEFCYHLQEINFDQYVVLDIFPYRQSAKAASELSIKGFKKAWKLAEKLDRRMVTEAHKNQDALTIFNQLFED
jgi:xylose isomerase